MSDLKERLWQSFASDHSSDAAMELEKMEAADAASALAALPPEIAARVGLRMAPFCLTRALLELSPGAAGAIFGNVSSRAAAGLLRGYTEERRQECLAAMPEPSREAIRLLLEHKPETAGSLMDPDYVAVPEDLTVGEVRPILRKSPVPCEDVFFVLERDRQLCGMVSLKTVASADPGTIVGAIKERVSSRLLPDIGVEQLFSNRDLHHQNVLPVVDADGSYLGGLRHDTVMDWFQEDFLNDQYNQVQQTGKAMGELFQSGLLGMVHAFASSVSGGKSAGTRPSLQKGEPS